MNVFTILILHATQREIEEETHAWTYHWKAANR